LSAVFPTVQKFVIANILYIVIKVTPQQHCNVHEYKHCRNEYTKRLGVNQVMPEQKLFRLILLTAN